MVGEAFPAQSATHGPELNLILSQRVWDLSVGLVQFHPMPPTHSVFHGSPNTLVSQQELSAFLDAQF